MLTIDVTGTESKVCEIIAIRQKMGIAKYGTTVSNNPLSKRAWAVHALEESLDLSIYLCRLIEQMDKDEDDMK